MTDDDEDGSSALERETKRVDDMTKSKEPGRGEAAGLAEKENVERVEQDARVQTSREQAKEAESGSKEPVSDLNEDG